LPQERELKEVMSMVDMESGVAEMVDSAKEKPAGETRKLEAGQGAAEPRPRRPETRKLPAEAATGLVATGPAPHLGLTREEMNWAAAAHASILVTVILGLVTGGLGAILGVAIPAVIWYSFRDRSEYVVDQARQATVFQLAGFVAVLLLALAGTVLVGVGWVVSAVLVIILVGLILLPLMLVVTVLWIAGLVALPIAQVVYGCYAAVEASNGRPFRYLWIADLIDRYQAQT
jgi:uncharacterized Tic20 family protein